MEELAEVRKLCEICGQPTMNERNDETEPPEGERTTCCDRWICPDCICWIESDESKIVCKDCCSCDSEYLFEDLSAEDFFDYSDDELYKSSWKIYIYGLMATGVIGLLFAIYLFIIHQK